MEMKSPRTLRKLTPEVHELLVYGVRRGRTMVHVCKLAGVSVAQLKVWRRCAEEGDEKAQALVADMEAAKLELRAELDNAMVNSQEVLRKALVVAAYRKVEALDSDDERTAQAAATEILDRFHGKPTQSINANVTAAVVVKGYIGVSPDDWDSDQPVQAAGVASGAVAGQESDLTSDG